AGLIHFAVALRAVAVADFEERAGNEYRNVQRASDDQLAVVEIAGVPARRIAADASELRRRRNTHAPVERLQGNDDAGSELGGHRLRVQVQNLHAGGSIAVLRDEPVAPVVGVVDGEVDRQHLHLEDVARLRALDEDRAGQNVAARAAPIAGDFAHDRLERLLDFVLRHTRALQTGWRVGEQRVDVDDIAGLDTQDRPGFRPVVAVCDRRRRCFEAMRLRLLLSGDDGVRKDTKGTKDTKVKPYGSLYSPVCVL